MSFVIVIIILALLFDYINGFHDAANSIATIVSTKVLTPFQAVMWAAFFNFIAFMIFKDHAVANTIGKTVRVEFVTLPVIFSGLIAAIMWNLFTWWWGIPSSSSHTLIGGFAGAAICHALMTKGMMPLFKIIDSEKIGKTVLFIFIAPLLGGLISMLFTFVTIHRNTWLKSGILLATSIGLWFLFGNFQQNKINENVSKYFKADKYQYEVDKLSYDLSLHSDPEMQTKLDETKLKLVKAKASAKACEKFTGNYEKIGPDEVANQIVNNVNIRDIEISKLKDKLNGYFKVEQLKIQSTKNKFKEAEYIYAKHSVDSLIPISKKYHSIGMDAMIKSMVTKINLDGNKIPEFTKKMRIDVKTDLKKEMEKADNHILRYCLIGMILLFICAFIYNEKMREPKASRTANMFKKLQLLSSAAFSIGHGGNDAQKVMGIIAAALIANGDLLDIKAMPDWVPLACYTAIALGTLSGGWKIVKTMGTKITKVTPLEGVCAETAGATTLFLTEQMGIPVSTTHTITGSIIGVGATKRLSAVRWGVTINILWAWILTIPISALLAALVFWISTFFL
ncbi:MAG: inorganic phosphate transporter [Bacteroidetes bacterium]|nr:inorganic phosphate transporter [Bacteroidota bacterium]